MATNRQWILRKRPAGLLAPGDLEISEAPLPSLADGQALARVKYLSVDPTMRVWMAGDSYMPAVRIGDVMRAAGLAEIVESRCNEFKKGDKVVGLTGLQDYCLINCADKSARFQKVPSIPFVSETAFLGVLGLTGVTAYFGMMDIAKPQKGETLVVSAAAGATGSIAGQIGKIHGCHVVGIAGGAEKCKWLTELGFDAAIDYKSPDWKQKLAEATPKGVDIDFENVGGEIMHAVLERMNPHSRMVVCGFISGYTKDQAESLNLGLAIVKRLHIQGFLVLDYLDRFMEAATQLGKWKMFGKLKDRETIVEGLEKAPEAINMLFTGGNIGKTIVKV